MPPQCPLARAPSAFSIMTDFTAPAFTAWRWMSSLALVAPIAAAPPQNTPSKPRTQVVTDVRLEAAEDAPLWNLVLREGRVEAILTPEDELPADAWIIDGAGHLALPAFVDAWMKAGVDDEDPTVDVDRPVAVNADVRVDMRVANRRGLQPSFQAAYGWSLEDGEMEKWQESGFGVALAAPGGQILAGTSAVVTLRSAAVRDLVVTPTSMQHATFRAARGGYPNTLMGHHAHLRQFFLDADHHGELTERWVEGRPGPRPAWDADLDSGGQLLSHDQSLACRATSARDIARWIRLADELGLYITSITAGRDAWKMADELAARGITVVLDLDWGDEVEEPSEEDAAAAFDYLEPLGVRQEKRRLWEERRDCALRLHEAGVTVLFGTGDGSAKDLLKNVRTLIEVGLPRDVALSALTADAANFMSLGHHYGWLGEGASATLCLWTADPLTEKDAQVAWCFVDGYQSEFEIKEAGAAGPPDEGVDVSGTWSVVIADGEEEQPMTLTLTMQEDGEIGGIAETISPICGELLTAEVSGGVHGNEVHLSMTFFQGMKIEVELQGSIDGNTIQGSAEVSMPGNEQTSDFEATRQPGGAK